MGENQENFEQFLSNLAFAVDNVENLVPRSKTVIIYEINAHDFENIRKNFKNIKIDENQIKIDISGTEVIFILENSYQQPEKKEEPEIKIGFFQKLKRVFTS
jgi:hypothetical protein